MKHYENNGHKKTRREYNRITGGLCSCISENHKVYLWINRFTFVITSWLLFVPFLIYLGLWIIIPSSNQFKTTDRTQLQPISIFFGAAIR
ncbi:PspC domain-containing protein [Psychroserpens sp.]|uniref:PspC domain-containing protein n=1 Tax=Psychroserpens sp. TaxID=2020870 RepID=UPI0039E4FD24